MSAHDLNRSGGIAIAAALLAGGLLAAMLINRDNSVGLRRLPTGAATHKLSNGEQNGAVNPPARQAEQPSSPCTLVGVTEVSAGESAAERWSLADFVENTTVIARVTGASSTPLRFDTPDGNPPPDLPAGADDYDEEQPQYNVGIFKTLAVNVDHFFKGAESLNGYTVTRPGGVHPACPDYEYRPVPLVLTGDSGDQGLVFLTAVPTELLSQPSARLQERLDFASQLSQPPTIIYSAMSLVNWFKYEGGTATSAWLGTYTVTDLEAQVEAIVGP